MSAAYDTYRSKPFEDIARADRLLNPDASVRTRNDGKPTSTDVALAHALIELARVKMQGSVRAR